MSEEIQPSQNPVQEPDNFNSILIGGGLIVFFGLVPYLSFVNMCCLGLIAGGTLSVWHYTNAFSLTLSSGEGFKLGALTGILGGLVLYVLQMLCLVLFDYQPGTEEMGMIMKSFMKGNPEALEAYEQGIQDSKLNAFSVKNIAIGVLSTVIIYPLFVGLGGTIGAALFKKAPEVK
ncbi:MAG: hypothetical protein SFU91_02785 [Chloroherpetonaceae bacterium]|nr:hypothetical protein [Chloroherpetonaceae bacterium]